MTQVEQRSIALSAVRGQMRIVGIQPETVVALEAHQVLDNLARSAPDLIASQWYVSCDDSQLELFYKEWEEWRVSYLALFS